MANCSLGSRREALLDLGWVIGPIVNWYNDGAMFNEIKQDHLLNKGINH